MDIGEKIIQDIIKGAAGAEGFMRGGSVGVERMQLGREEKLASNYGGLGGLVGPVGAAAGAEDGSGWRAAGGSLLGGTLGGAAGFGLGALLNNPAAARFLEGAGGMGGSALGGHLGGAKKEEPPQGRLRAIADAFTGGKQAAYARYKVAFLGAIAPLLGSVAGPALARGAMGRVAPTLAKGLAGGARGAMFDTAASLAGGALGNKMTGQQ